MAIKLSHFPKGKKITLSLPKIYLSYHPDDFEAIELISNLVLSKIDAIVYYIDYTKYKDIDFNELAPLIEGSQLFIIFASKSYLTKPSFAFDKELPFIKSGSYPLLPLLESDDLNDIFNDKFESTHYVSLEDSEINQKIKSFLDNTIIDKEKTETIENDFKDLIFFSYRKIDKVIAKEFLKELHNHPELIDVGLWYDDFLVPGNNFDEDILKKIDKSNIFMMCVTPNLLVGDNYVKTKEYPHATRKGHEKEIVPVEVEKTDKNKFKEEYKKSPDPVNKNEVSSYLKKFVSSSIRNDEEHLYLLGMAYLYGINVYRDPELGISLITKSADKDYLKANEELINIYRYGIGSKVDPTKMLYYAERVINILKNRDDNTLDSAIDICAAIYKYANLINLGRAKPHDIDNFSIENEDYFEEKIEQFHDRDLNLLYANYLMELGKYYRNYNKNQQDYDWAERFYLDILSKYHETVIKEDKRLWRPVSDAYLYTIMLMSQRGQYSDASILIDDFLELINVIKPKDNVKAMMLASLGQMLFINNHPRADEFKQYFKGLEKLSNNVTYKLTSLLNSVQSSFWEGNKEEAVHYTEEATKAFIKIAADDNKNRWPLLIRLMFSHFWIFECENFALFEKYQNKLEEIIESFNGTDPAYEEAKALFYYAKFIFCSHNENKSEAFIYYKKGFECYLSNLSINETDETLDRVFKPYFVTNIFKENNDLIYYINYLTNLFDELISKEQASLEDEFSELIRVFGYIVDYYYCIKDFDNVNRYFDLVYEKLQKSFYDTRHFNLFKDLILKRTNAASVYGNYIEAVKYCEVAFHSIAKLKTNALTIVFDWLYEIYNALISYHNRGGSFADIAKSNDEFISWIINQNPEELRFDDTPKAERLLSVMGFALISMFVTNIDIYKGHAFKKYFECYTFLLDKNEDFLTTKLGLESTLLILLVDQYESVRDKLVEILSIVYSKEEIEEYIKSLSKVIRYFPSDCDQHAYNYLKPIIFKQNK